MPTTTLTARFVESRKASTRRAEYFDGMVRGLALRVSPTGTKSWVLLYRVQRRLRRWTLGGYPTLSLADARVQGRAGLRQVALGLPLPSHCHFTATAAPLLTAATATPPLEGWHGGEGWQPEGWPRVVPAWAIIARSPAEVMPPNLDTTPTSTRGSAGTGQPRMCRVDGWRLA